MPTNFRLYKDNVLMIDNLIPRNCKERNQVLKIMGVEHISYHAYINEYILYKGYTEVICGQTYMSIIWA